MSETLKPIVLSADSKEHAAAQQEQVDASYINKETLVSSDANNLLEVDANKKLLVDKTKIPQSTVNPADLISAKDDNQLALEIDNKLYVPKPVIPTAQDLVSSESDNQIEVRSDKLYVPKPADVAPADLISANAGNIIGLGTDNKLMAKAEDIDPSKLISTDTGNRLTEGSDQKLFVAKQEVVPADLISTDINNSITRGTDNRLRVKVVSDDADNLLTRGSDLGAKVKASDMISNGSTENLIVENSTDHGLEVKRSDVEAVVNTKLKDVIIVSEDANNILHKGTDGGALLNATDLPEQVSAGEGITVNGGRVSVNIGKGLDINSTTNKVFVNVDDLDIKQITLAASEKILALTEDKVLSSELHFSYSQSTGYLTILGKNGQTVDSVFMPGAEQALIGVEVVVNPVGFEPGTYFKYTFATAGGSTTSYVKVPEGSTVEAGDGINANTSGGVTTVSAKAGLGVTVDSVGISVKPSPDKGIFVDSTGVGVKVKANGGILTGADGLEFDPNVVPTEAELGELANRVTTAEGNITSLQGGLTEISNKHDALQEQVNDLALDSVGITVSNIPVDPADLDKGTGALFPAQNLLSVPN